MKTLEDVVSGDCTLNDYAESLISNLNGTHEINKSDAYINKSNIINELTNRIQRVMHDYADELEHDLNVKTHITDDCFYVRFNDGSQLETILNGSYAIRTNKMREYSLKTLQYYNKDYNSKTIDSWDI